MQNLKPLTAGVLMCVERGLSLNVANSARKSHAGALACMLLFVTGALDKMPSCDPEERCSQGPSGEIKMGRNRPVHWNFREMRRQRKADHLCWKQIRQVARRFKVLLASYWCQINAFISVKQTVCSKVLALQFFPRQRGFLQKSHTPLQMEARWILPSHSLQSDTPQCPVVALSVAHPCSPPTPTPTQPLNISLLHL